MKHPQAEILKAYAEDTSVEIEWFTQRIYLPADIGMVVIHPEREYRIKPAMRSITLSAVIP
jgi:hypothetical protein